MCISHVSKGTLFHEELIKATCSNNNLFQRIMALLSFYLSVSFRHTFNDFDNAYTRQKKYKFYNLVFCTARGPQPEKGSQFAIFKEGHQAFG